MIFTQIVYGQNTDLKKTYSASEIIMLENIFEEMSFKDQEYRSLISNNTLDPTVSEKIDSVFNNVGIAEGFAYKKSISKGKLPQAVLDSLWSLQHINDLSNHLKLKGIFDTYGFIPEEIIGKSYSVQILILLHPPTEWDIENYHQSYAEMLLPEVLAKRMSAKSYATFYDNMLAKILKKPSLYGTGKHFNPKTRTELPAIIESIEKTNTARELIGLAPLQSGEYRLSSSLD